MNNFTTTITISKSLAEVWDVILNVRAWWSGLHGEEITGESKALNDEFSFNAGGGMHYSKQKLVELVPGKKVKWLVTDSKLDFLTDKTEWNNTSFEFELSESNGHTTIQFTHNGLTPEVECYNACAPAWTKYIQQQLVKALQ